MLHIKLNHEKVAVISQAKLIHKKHDFQSRGIESQKHQDKKLLYNQNEEDKAQELGRQIQQIRKNKAKDKLLGKENQENEKHMRQDRKKENTFPVNSETGKKLNLTGNASSCWGVVANSGNPFQETVDGVLVYSAFWDKRGNDFDNQDKGVYVRIMAIIKLRYKPKLYCLFQAGDKVYSSQISYYEMCENHMRPYGGYILSCKVPKEVKNIACSVVVSDQPEIKPNPLRTKILPTSANHGKRKFSVCVPPVFGSPDRTKIVEFVELSQILGAEHITFYDYNANEDLLKVLNYYQSKGIVTVLPWHLPEKIDESALWYKGQLITIQDCLYRHMALSEYVSFNDIDEFLTPHKRTYWSEMLADIDTPKHCGFQFKMAFFDPEKAHYKGDSKYTKLVSVTHTQRTSVLSRVRTKCMVKPLQVFEKGIHHISKPIYADLKTEQVDPGIGFLHHYRACLSDFGMSCYGYEEDRKLSMFADTLFNKVQKSLTDLNI